MRYTIIPREITSFEVIAKNCSLSPSHYKTVLLPNKNFYYLRDLISQPVRGKDEEAIDFLRDSKFYYLKTKALKDDQYLIETEENGCLKYLHPKAFAASINLQRSLKEGDILYCSSGGEEIGEAALVTEIASQITYSSHSFKINIANSELKFYILCFLKSKFCKEQLSNLVYKGATLRRGGDKFLELKIPFPNQENTDEVTRYIEELTKAVINKEKEIRCKHKQIHALIRRELEENQKPNKFVYEFPDFKEVAAEGRLDTGIYTKAFKEIDFLIKNYSGGHFLSAKTKSPAVRRRASDSFPPK